VFIKTSTYIVPTPSILTSEDIWAWLTLDNTNIKSQVTNFWKNIPNIWNVNYNTWALVWLELVATWIITSDSTDAEKEAVMLAIQSAYTDCTELASSDIYAYILSKTTIDDLVVLVDTVVLGSSVAVPTNTTTYSCTWTVPTSNVTKTNDTGLTVDTAWQTTTSWNDCYYECSSWYTWTNCEIEPPLITSTDCTIAWWIWVDTATDVYIWTTRWDWFCISPRVWDFAWDTTWNGISWNGWWNQADWNYGWWDSSPIDDGTYSVNSTWNPYPELWQTRKLDSEWGYTCKALWTATDIIDSDTIVWRMKWLTINKVNFTAIKNIDWVQNATPQNDHPIPALYIADCIDWVKNLWTTMTYTHNENSQFPITYADYNTDVILNTDTAYLSDITYQNRQKYLTAWTQETGSHLPSAMSYITSWAASANDTVDWDFLIWNDRWEYQVACEASLLTDANDDTDDEWIWLSAIGFTNGTGWGRRARVVGNAGCGDQYGYTSGYRTGTFSARFVVRP